MLAKEVEGGAKVPGRIVDVVETVLRLVKGVVREEGGPVIDAVVGYQASYGHGLVGVGLGQGEGGSQTSAKIRAVDEDVAPGEVSRREVLDDPLVTEEDVVERCRPTPIAARLASSWFVRVQKQPWPSVVQRRSGIPLQPAWRVEVGGIIAVAVRERWDPQNKRTGRAVC